MQVLKQGNQPANSVNWRSVCVFYIVACCISWPVFWIRDFHADIWDRWQFPWWFNKGWLPAFGPLIGCLLASWIFRRTHCRRITLFGTSALRSIGLVVVMLVSIAMVGVGTDEPHLTGLLFAASYAVYGFLEESGWRGFLQDALIGLPERWRYLSIGVLWGAWHFTSFTGGTPMEAVRRLFLMALLWVFGSWGIGVMVERTRSLSVAAMLHLVFNLSRALPVTKLAIVLCVCALGWWLLMLGWPKPPVLQDNVVQKS